MDNQALQMAKPLEINTGLVNKLMDKVPTKKTVEQVKKQIEYQRAKDAEIVRGIFRFYEIPGGTLEFTYGPIYKGDEQQNYKLTDGMVYSLPLGVARHLNKNCWYPVHKQLLDESGKPSIRIGQKVRRCGFQSLEFVDIEDLTPVGNGLYTAELTHL